MIWWITLFTFVTCLSYAFTAYASYTSIWARFTLSRLSVHLSCISLVTFSWIALYYHSIAKDAIGLTALEGYKFNSYLDFIWVLLVIVICLAILNTVVNILRIQPAYFLFAVLSIALLLLVICANGENLRLIRNTMFDKGLDNNCMENLALIHRD